MVDQQNLIEAKGLRCHSVGPLDLSVAGGRCLALTGPSGSGKSLVMRMMADLVPHEGSCSLDGVSADTVAPPLWRSWVRYVAAEPGWWEGTVGAHFRKPATQIPLLQRLHLDPAMLDMIPGRLSTGERQRVAFLRAIEDRPRVLLLDEPTSALDSDATIIVESIIRERLAEGCAAVVTSHDPAQVERLADAVITLGAR